MSFASFRYNLTSSFIPEKREQIQRQPTVVRHSHYMQSDDEEKRAAANCARQWVLPEKGILWQKEPQQSELTKKCVTQPLSHIQWHVWTTLKKAKIIWESDVKGAEQLKKQQEKYPLTCYLCSCTYETFISDIDYSVGIGPKFKILFGNVLTNRDLLLWRCHKWI